MKKSLFILVLLSVVCISARASMTVEQSTDSEYLINSGYSQAVVEDVFMQKNRTEGKTIEPLYEKSNNKCVKVLRKIYAYLDPSIDEEDRLHHDINLSPSYTDL